MKNMDELQDGDWDEGFEVKGLPKTQTLPITGTITELKENKELTDLFLEKFDKCGIDLEIKIQDLCPTLYNFYKDAQTQTIDFGGRWWSSSRPFNNETNKSSCR